MMPLGTGAGRRMRPLNIGGGITDGATRHRVGETGGATMNRGRGDGLRPLGIWRGVMDGTIRHRECNGWGPL